MATNDLFLVRRAGRPILLVHATFGALWADEEIVFKRPIEKLGANLLIEKNDEFFTDGKDVVTKIVAHWKKITNRRLRKLQETNPDSDLSSVISLGGFDED